VPLYPIPRNDPPGSLSDLVRRSRAVSPWISLLSTGVIILAGVVFLVAAPTAVGTYAVIACATASALLLVRGWAGPFRKRRAWLLEIAERAAYGYVAFRPPLALPNAPVAATPDVDELIELTLRLDGTAPFLLRPGERSWLQATTTLLIHATGAPK